MSDYNLTDRTHPLYSAKSSVRRAKKHLSQFQALEAEFCASNPFSIEERTEGDSILHVLKVKGGLPHEIEDEFWSFIISARSSIDQAVSSFGGDSFPITKDQSSFEKSLNGKRLSLHDDFVQIIRDFNPYRADGGNLLLCLINDFANASKHRKLALVPPNISRFRTNYLAMYGTGSGGSAQIGIGSSWDFAREEMVINRIAKGRASNIAIFDFGVDVNLNITALGSETLLPTDLLPNLFWVASGVVSSFEGKAIELRLI